MLLLFCLGTQTASNRREYTFLQYMDCLLALYEVGKELVYMCLTRITTDGEHHSAILRAALNNRKDLKIVEWFGLEPYNEICGILHILNGSYAIPPQSRALQWLHHCF